MKPLLPVISAALLISISVALSSCGDSAASSAGEELFNGRDFTGWKTVMARNAPPEATWSVADGVIRCTGQPNGYLRTEKRYGNCRVRVEWRFLKPGNTGVMVFMQEPDQVWPRCVECQGMHGHQGDFWFWGGVGCDAPSMTLQNGVPIRDAGSENPPGEWNTMECVCRGNSVEILVNGRSVNKITGCNVSSGFVGIQSEGAAIEIRRVTVGPLTNHPPTP